MTRVAILPVPTIGGNIMDLWRAARDTGGNLPAVEQAELDDLVEEEVRASGERTAALLREIGS